MSQLSVSDAESLGKRKRELARLYEHLIAKVRAKVEHPFRVIKRQFGHVKVRYRGLAKNTAQLHVLFALSNLWMVRKRLLAPTGQVRPLVGQNRPISGGWMKLRKVFAKQQIQINSLQNQNRTCSATVMP